MLKPLLIRLPGIAVKLSFFTDLAGGMDYTCVIARIRRKKQRIVSGEVKGAWNDIDPDVVRLIAANGPAVLEWLDRELPEIPSLHPPQHGFTPDELHALGPIYPRRSSVPCDNCGAQHIVQVSPTDIRCETCGWRGIVTE